MQQYSPLLLLQIASGMLATRYIPVALKKAVRDLPNDQKNGSTVDDVHGKLSKEDLYY